MLAIEIILLSVFMVFLSTFLFYEVLSVVLKVISKNHLKTRPLMLFLVTAIFSAHTLAIWIYGLVYWVMVHTFHFKPLSGIDPNNFLGYIYFSAATYSSLGIGDVFPLSPAMQFLTGVQVLNGLMLIGWSVTFTYFSVQKLWDLHLTKQK